MADHVSQTRQTRGMRVAQFSRARWARASYRPAPLIFSSPA